MYHNDTDEKLQQLCTNNNELDSLMKQYEEDNKFLLSQITHEIRNPLTLIYSTLQLIEHKNPDVTQINYWSNLKEDMKDVFSLLDRLSEYNHCNTLDMTSVNIHRLLTDLIESFKTYMPEKNIVFTVSIEKEAKSYIANYSCDATKIRQVFINLLKNAVEAVNSNGTISINVSITETHLLIAITNTGSSIPEEEQEHIFTPFITTKPTGTGLGLPTVKKILLSHNGTIAVHSAHNTTTFTVALPITEAHQ